MNTHSSHLHRKYINKGFTLVETLIAITVLMIAIAGPLVVASKGLTAALISRDQMTASLLAQESMEMVKNTRDNNIAAGRVWNDGILACVDAQCDFDPFDTTLTNSCPSDGCQLYFSSAGYRNNPSGGGQPSLFKRYFTLTSRASNDYVVTVVVGWYHGTVFNEVRLASELTSAIK